MRLSPLRLVLPVLLFATLAGCSTTKSCGENEEYLAAEERPRLELPPSMVASERVDPIVIPPLAPDAQQLDPKPRCLDFPPPYFVKRPPAAKPAAPSASGSAPAAAAPPPAAPAQSSEPTPGKP